MSSISPDILARLQQDDLKFVLEILDNPPNFKRRMCKVCRGSLPEDPFLEIYNTGIGLKISRKKRTLTLMCPRCVNTSNEVFLSNSNLIKGSVFFYPQISEIQKHREYVRALLNITELFWKL